MSRLYHLKRVLWLGGVFAAAASTSAAQQPDGSFAGRLPVCNNFTNVPNAPCVAAASFSNSDFGFDYSTTVDAPAGEPTIGH